MIKKVFALLLLAGVSHAACFGNAYCYDDNGLYLGNSFKNPVGIASVTLSQMNLLTPTAAGQLIYVSDGLQGRVCVSSGTGTGAWIVVAATSTAVIGGLLGHCQ